jgi:hypothetical protein
LHDLEHVRRKEGKIDHEEKGREQSGAPDAPLPVRSRQHIEENRRDGHRSSDRDSVRGGERAGGPEHQHHQNAPDSQCAIHFGNEYLSRL